MSNFTSALFEAQKQDFDPWSLPDTFTVYNFAPEDIRSFLHPHWQTQKAPHPIWYYFLGLFYVVIGVIAIGGNYMVLRIFSHAPALRTPSNILIMNLAITDFMLMFAMIPECAYNFLTGGPWRFGNIGCQLHSFTGAMFGCSQINTLLFISWDRYNVIVRGFAAAPLTYSKAILTIIFIWIWSLGWAICPLVGWGAYAMDGMLGTCSYDMVSQSMNNKSFILSLFSLGYVLPVTSIIGFYYFIVMAVFRHEDELRHQAKKMNVVSLRSNSEQQAMSAEIRIAKVSITNVTLWLMAWTPFAVVALIGNWGDVSLITPISSTLPSALAKTACAYNPMVYGISHPKFREVLKDLYPWLCIVLPNKSTVKNDDNLSNATEFTENLPTISEQQ